MAFKNIKPKEIILIGIAVVCVVVFLFKHFFSHDPSNAPAPAAAVSQLKSSQPAPSLVAKILDEKSVPAVLSNDAKMTDEGEGNNETIDVKEMHDQMDKEREQQKQIKLLNLKIEQARLQNELEKQITETNKLRKDNAGIVKGSDNFSEGRLPDVKLLYIGITDTEKEALVTISGSNYSVKEKDRPVENVEIEKITNKDILVKFMTGENKSETATFKLE